MATIQDKFEVYVRNFDMNDSMIRRKYEHTHGVARILADFEPHKISLALGYYHDLARFPQAEIYHTFDDSASIDHAYHSAEILEESEDFFLDGYTPEEKTIIIEAIRYHNKLTLPDTMTKEERDWCDILRDADMLENMQRLETEYEDITGYSLEECQKQDITPEVADCLRNHKLVDNRFVQNGIDVFCRYIGFANGMTHIHPVKELGMICDKFTGDKREELRVLAGLD